MKDVMGTVKEVEVAGMANAVTIGGVVSGFGCTAGRLVGSPGKFPAMISWRQA
jgi:hypothetical protein